MASLGRRNPMLRARDIADICEELAIERVSITTKEVWDNTAMFFLNFGPLAYRQAMEIDPKSEIDAVRARLEAARASPLSVAPSPAPEAKPSPAVTPAPAKGKRKQKGEVV